VPEIATYSTYLGLKLNSATDPFLLSDFIGNWTILDGSPGVYVCTSTSRPAWTAAQGGRLIFMTDYKALSFWDGAAWNDCRDAAPVFASGVYLNANIAKGTTGTYTVINLTTPRACSLAIAVTGTYQCVATSYQDVWQRVLVDGVGATGNQLGGYREQLRFTASPGTSGNAGMCGTSFQVVTGITPGAHTIGLAADIGTITNTAITIIGIKAMAWIALTSPTNSL
jgi:hypothetical protein